jgi:hypothetical protein
LLDAPVLRIFQPVNHWYMRITRAPAPRAIAGQNQCPVCLESRAVLQHHECVHAVCAPCFAACITHSRDACPLCRAPLALMQSP